MSTAFRFLAVAVALSTCASAQVCQPEADKFVQNALQNPRDYFNMGFAAQRVRSYGDCAASALVRGLRLSDFRDPDIAAMVVKAMDWAFRGGSPGVLVDRNKHPQAALFLLDVVAEYATEEPTKQDARDLLQRLQAPKPEQ